MRMSMKYYGFVILLLIVITIHIVMLVYNSKKTYISFDKDIQRDIQSRSYLGEILSRKLKEAYQVGQEGNNLKAGILLYQLAAAYKILEIEKNGAQPSDVEMLALHQFEIAKKEDVINALLRLQYPNWTDTKPN
ncbi:MAG: hypothetical protein JW828_00340 [Sedimentisphaerales bacterium]|nr:hypothetical protein [Sedimentisphaerales bacterium]